MKQIYLYLKRHNKTGLQYFGKTIRDPYTYHGSGVYWNAHLTKHSDDIETVWVKLFTSQEELTRFALEYSETNNIVESAEYANLKIEDGLMGGNTTDSMPQDKLILRNLRISKALTGKQFTAEHKEKLSKATTGTRSGKNNGMYKRQHTDATLEKMRGPRGTFENMSVSAKKRAARKIECKHCGKLTNDSNHTRWHGSNCKEVKNNVFA